MPEEKTRIVPRAATSAADTITFHCDNGHRINVPARLAGKRGTCSKCGIAVVIPLTAAGAGRIAAPPAVETVPAATAADVPEPPATSEPPAAPSVDSFANLFDTSAPAEAPVNEEIMVDVGGGAGESTSGGGSAVGDVVAGYAPEEYAAPDEGNAVDNPTAQLVARLWVECRHGGVVELHVAGGGVILPKWYESRWSRGTHGLFASEAADGTVTLTAVAWDSIQKIVVRQVEGLPDGMFENE